MMHQQQQQHHQLQQQQQQRQAGSGGKVSRAQPFVPKSMFNVIFNCVEWTMV